MSRSSNIRQEEPIAIIGTGCRFPGSSSTPSQLWELLRQPKHVACTIPADRFSIAAFYHEDGKHHRATNASESYFLTEDIRRFDASFFNISASEAVSIDPQQRLLLESVYESLESAGLRIGDLKGSDTAVFAGVMCDDYSAMLFRDADALPQYSATGTARSIISNRVSYFFDWHGASLTLDTACSSSLVAVDLAVHALRRGESRVAVAAGTSLILGPGMYISESKLGMLSPTGKSRMWDSQADGYARGEGVASIVLKRLSDALADGDPIECLVRATGVNSDGRSMGITMPSGAAQEHLIRSTYVKAGLDIINNPDHRPQYFEAHGTGTPAGDPQEASAIYNAFFSSDVKAGTDDFLHVGSIKTIIGHTEGTAGLAGLIKVSLSMRNDTIPPNLHLRHLNPKIAPMVSRLRVPTKAIAWPKLAPGVPKRASVNSFGFGGTNAHAIIESFEYKAQTTADPAASRVLPFVFSATSEKSLGAVLDSYLTFLEDHPDIDLSNLAWSLLKRRADFAYRIAFNAGSFAELLRAIENELAQRKNNEPSTVVSRIAPSNKQILGIFTGQGAQWPQMGLDLLRASPEARGWIEELQESLDTLPAEYRPSFKLLDMLSASPETSRVQEALVAQPICTAVQIMLVRFLRALTITFSTVIGHSSGEIGAAYAAGILNASEAIRVAHLRGHLAKLSGNGHHKGAMMAVGMSFAEAQSVCDGEDFNDKIKVAAFNSPSSVTLSGDEEAIARLEIKLKQENKFARRLKVDTAYHSHHMLSCSKAYLEALNSCNINPKVVGRTRWFSSVYNGEEITSVHADILKGKYWIDNMVNPVLFSQALTTAVCSSSFDTIIEIGPHSALKGPAFQTISEISEIKTDIPYSSLLSRGESAITSMSSAVGHIWTYLGPNAADIESYVKLFDSNKTFTFTRDLPTYPFDHSQSYWADTRLIRAFMHNEAASNQLLGSLTDDTTEDEWRWRNFLRREEIDWLGDHKIQSQAVFPATGYVAMAIEAMLAIGKNRSINLIELHDVTIGQAIALRDDPTGVETLFKLTNLVFEKDQTSAEFSCHADIGGALKRCAGGRISVTFGDELLTLLPHRHRAEGTYYPIDTTKFYKHLSRLGYGYEGRFQSILSLLRTKDLSTGLIKNTRGSDSQSPIFIHPALMDTLLQTLLAAVGDTKDNQLYSIHIPTSIERITINPFFYTVADTHINEELAFDAAVTTFSADGVSGIAELFDDAGNGVMQMEGITVAPLMKPTAADDRKIFSYCSWERLEPDATLPSFQSTVAETREVEFLERSTLLYIRDSIEKLATSGAHAVDKEAQQILSWFQDVLSSVKSGTHPYFKSEWLSQRHNDLAKAFDHISPSRGCDALRIVGEAYTSNFVDRINTVSDPEVRIVLEDYFHGSECSVRSSQQIGQIASQIIWRYPRLRILEVGGGRGQITRSVLHSIQDAYHSYTFTDNTDEYFEELRSDLGTQAAHFTFKTLDIQQSVTEQGFQEHWYDFIIIRDTPYDACSRAETLLQIKTLLKPGGFLVAAENMSSSLIHHSFLLTAIKPNLQNWSSDCTPVEWNSMLVNAGFAGIETITPAGNTQVYSVLVSRAMSEEMNVLRDPFNNRLVAPLNRQLCIIGGKTKLSTSVSATLIEILAPFFAKVITSPDFVSLKLDDDYLITSVCLTDLDGVTLRDMGKEAFTCLKTLVEKSKEMIWLSLGSDTENVSSGMIKGMMRVLAYEFPESRYQYYNVVNEAELKANTLAKAVLQLSQTHAHNDYKLEERVWSVEPELRLRGGILEIERLKISEEQNRRYMAGRRTIYDTIDLKDTDVQLVEAAGHFEFYAQDKTTPKVDPTAMIKVQYSTLNAVRVSNELSLHVILGTNVESKTTVIALANKCGSLVSTPAEWVLSSIPPKCDPAAFLEATALALIADSLMRKCKPNSSVLIHEANTVMRYALLSCSYEYHLDLHFSTTRADKKSSGIILLHERISNTSLKSILPKHLSTVIDLSISHNGMCDRILSLQSGHVAHETLESLTSCSADSFDNQYVKEASKTLCMAVELASRSMISLQTVNLIEVKSLSGKTATNSNMQIVDWSKATSVQAKVRQASSMIYFSPNKTYLLIGLTGDLGRSMCKWMVTRGARHVVLTSRNPKIVPKWWLDQLSDMGANIVPMPMDVTSKESILEVDCTIRREMPPLGGVFNGALVITDTIFSRLTYEDLLRGIAPKVDGSKFLDELYSTNDLDFFIMFGSTGGMAGHPAQTPYCVGNVYMEDVIRSRRARGLVGSILNSGLIVGVGVVHRDEHREERSIKMSGSACLSEKDVHECFAECIIAGLPESHLSPQVVAGASPRDPAEWDEVVWYNNPRVWRRVDFRMSGSCLTSIGATLTMKEKLMAATNLEEAEQLVLEGFIDMIRFKLKLSPGEIVSPAISPIEFGIDSLIALDFRNWFSKDLAVDVPILKLLSGASVGEIANFAAHELPVEMVPNVKEDKTDPEDNSPSDSTALSTREESPTLVITEPAKSAETASTRSTRSDLEMEYHTDTSTSIRTLDEESQGVLSDILPTVGAQTLLNEQVFQKVAKLSFPQTRYWFLNHYMKDKTTHNVTSLISIEGGSPDPDQAAEAIRIVTNRHETFRTCYLQNTEEINEPVQAIMPQSNIRLEVIRVESDKHVREKYIDVQNHAYDIEKGDVARILLVITPSGRQSMILGYHHICMDAISSSAFLFEVQVAYWKQPLPPVAQQYTTFAMAQRLGWDRGEMKQELIYWKRQFRTLPEPIGLLPMAKSTSRPVLDAYDLEELDHIVSTSTMTMIHEACRKTGSTVFHFFLATLRVFLNRLSDSEDFCIGVADSGRLDPASQGTIGLLLNILPLRFQSTTRDVSFQEILKDTRTKAFDALKYSKLPFGLLLDELAVPRSSSHSPLFQVLLDWNGTYLQDASFSDFSFRREEFLPSKTGFDLSLVITQSPRGEANIRFRLQKSLYAGQQATLVVKAFATLIESLAVDPSQSCENASLFEKVELEKAIELGKGQSLESNWSSTVSRRIEDLAASHAEQPAVKEPFGDILTYQELDQKANALATEMQKLGVTPNSPVCLFQHPMTDWLTSLLAIWKLDAVYVPFDLRNPTQRLKKMVQDCKPSLILYHNETLVDIQCLGYPDDKIFNVSKVQVMGAPLAIKNQSRPESRAAILYTSGSTGEPKGVQLRHSGIRNWVEGYSKRWGLGAEIVLQQAAMTFDHSLDQILVGLTNGGCVVFAPKEIRGDPMSLAKVIQEEHITYTKATPAEYANWLRYGSQSLRKATNWKFAIAGGEHLTTGLASLFRSLELPSLRLFNSYGPVEISISSHKGEIDYKTDKSTPGNIYPVGESHPNYTTIIVDSDLKPVPQGVSGEILITGAGPCMGYLNLDKINDDKFIQSSHMDSDYAAEGWTKAYRTSDRGHLIGDGSLVIEGRMDGDSQIKLRGIRMELEDIENTIIDTANGALSRAVVGMRGQNDQFLIVHVVFSSEAKTDTQRIFLQGLRKKLPLPQYMIPSLLIPVDDFPLNIHGKTDRRAIAAWPLPAANRMALSSEKFESENELTLLNVWQEVLGEAFGHDIVTGGGGSIDFFLAGGNSIGLLKLQAALYETFNVHLTIRELFESSTLGAMVDLIKDTAPARAIDWAEETSLDGETLNPDLPRLVAKQKASDLTVVLTGASGFLGKAILAKLITDPRVSRIHAVAVRPHEGGRQLRVSDKLTVHYGNLAAAQFGLEASTFNAIADEADLIVHCGANRSFWDAYSVLRGANVSSTKTVIQLASQRGTPIHFFSSGDATLDSLEHCTPPTDGSDGYVASKWASEQLLKKAADKFGLHITLHRFANQNSMQSPPPELEQELRSLIDELRCIPVAGGWSGSFELMPVAHLVDAVMEASVAAGDEAPRVLVHRAAVSMSTRDLVAATKDTLRDRSDEGYEMIPAVKWLGRAKKEHGFAWIVTAQNAEVGGARISKR